MPTSLAQELDFKKAVNLVVKSAWNKVTSNLAAIQRPGDWADNFVKWSII